MKIPNVLEWAVFAALLFGVGVLVAGELRTAEIRAENERLAAEVAAQDSAVAHLRVQRESAIEYAAEMADSVARIAADARREVERVNTRVGASRDSIAILRARLDSVPEPIRVDVDALVVEYETIIEAKDTVIAIVSRELAATRLQVGAMDTALAAALVEVDAQANALQARDRQIVNLERALDNPGLLPDGIVGQILAGLAGFGIGMLAAG